MVLSECRQGDTVTVVKIAGVGSVRKRLLEMGITAGQHISIVKYAPLRDPLELTLKGFHVSLRVNEAQLIEVQETGE